MSGSRVRLAGPHVVQGLDSDGRDADLSSLDGDETVHPIGELRRSLDVACPKRITHIVELVGVL